MVLYKAKEKGQYVNRLYRCSYAINRICALCGVELETEPKTDVWICPQCGTVWIKSLNAAKNVQRLTEDCIQDWKATSGNND